MSIVDSEITNEAEPQSATGAGLISFLSNVVIEKNYMKMATASALRTGAKKVLEVVDSLDDLDIRTADIDDILHRFKSRNWGKISDKSIEVYEQRFRQSVDMYTKWLAHDKDWLPRSSRRSSTKASTGGGSAARTPAKSGEAQPEQQAPATPATPSPSMITCPFPVRPGVHGKVTLPEDLTQREAHRVAAFIATLAFDEPAEAKALPATTRGETSA